MAKRRGNKQAARERLARLRAERRRWRIQVASSAAVAVVIAVVTGIILAVTGGGSGAVTGATPRSASPR